MSLMRLIALCVLLVSFTASGFANAGVCCCMKAQKSSDQKSEMEMPCHKSMKQETKHSKECKKCGCDHCNQVTFIAPLPFDQKLPSAQYTASKLSTPAVLSIAAVLPPPRLAPRA